MIMELTRRSLVGVALLLSGLLAAVVGLLIALVAAGAAHAARVPPADRTHTRDRNRR